MAKGNTLVVDVRDAPEVKKTGKVTGAVNVSRGMLEFRADPETPYHDKSFAKDKTIIVYCASGRRSVARCSRTWAMPRFTILAPSRTGPTAAGRWTSRSKGDRSRSAASGWRDMSRPFASKENCANSLKLSRMRLQPSKCRGMPLTNYPRGPTDFSMEART
jgi:hypothetical protein